MRSPNGPSVAMSGMIARGIPMVRKIIRVNRADRLSSPKVEGDIADTTVRAPPPTARTALGIRIKRLMIKSTHSMVVCGPRAIGIET